MPPKQERFITEYLTDLNATRAYQTVYGVSESVAAANGSRLLRNAKVAAEIAKVQNALAEKAGISREWVIERLVQNHERAMQAEPVMVYDKDAKAIVESGEYVYQGAVANKALELIGKHLGMFVDRKDITSNGQSLLELLAVVKQIEG